jgi:hypothetical protein
MNAARRSGSWCPSCGCLDAGERALA